MCQKIYKFCTSTIRCVKKYTSFVQVRFMDPKNIQEFVARQVIAHLAYRDTELSEKSEQLRQCEAILRIHGVFQCAKCKIYSDECQLCDSCEKNYCPLHSQRTWDGVYEDTRLCKECVSNACHVCGAKGYKSCRFCKTVRCSGRCANCRCNRQ